MISEPVLRKLVAAEIKRQQGSLNFIASENYVSNDVLEILGSPLTNKYSEGYSGRRYYAGNAVIDQVEDLTILRARRAFRLSHDWHVNVQPYSGSPANLAVYVGLLKQGEKIMGMSLPFGGHLTHGWKVSATGKFFTPVQYTLGKDGLLDYDAIRELALKEKPQIIVAGATAYPRIIDFKKFADIAHEVGAYLMVDMAHIAGLIAAGAHPSPFPYADVVTTTTHKTLRGPRGALIFANRKSQIAEHKGVDIALVIDKAVFPGLQGGPHDNQTAAIAMCLYEAASPKFKTYGKQIVKNAKALSAALMNLGFTILTGGTDNHLMLVDVTPFGISGRDAQTMLESAGIILNCNTIPFDTRSPFDPSGIRIGTPAVTTRGMKEREMKFIANLFKRVLIDKEPPMRIQKEVVAFCKRFPLWY